MQVKLSFWCDIRDAQEVLYVADKIMLLAMEKREDQRKQRGKDRCREGDE